MSAKTKRETDPVRLYLRSSCCGKVFSAFGLATGQWHQNPTRLAIPEPGVNDEYTGTF